MTDTPRSALDRLRSDLEDQHYRLSETLHQDLDKTLKRTQAALQRFEAERDRILEEMLDRLKDQHAPVSGRLRESLTADAAQAAKEAERARLIFARAVEEVGPGSTKLLKSIDSARGVLARQVEATFQSIDYTRASWTWSRGALGLMAALLMAIGLVAGIWSTLLFAESKTVPHFVDGAGRRYVKAKAGTKPERQGDGSYVCEVE